MEINKLIKGDAFEELKKIKNNSIDLVFTDPPFNLHWKQQIELHGRKAFYHNYEELKEWDKMDKKTYERMFKEFDRVVKDNGSVLIFVRTEYITWAVEAAQANNFDVKATIAYVKTNPPPQIRKKNYLSSFETLVWFARWNKDFCPFTFNFKTQKEMHNFITGPICAGKERIKYKNKTHPTQKSLALIKHLLEIHSNPGDLVLDPFAGCFDKKTEVLTKRGWINFKNIKKNDLIYSLNPDSHKIEIVPFTKKIYYYYNGIMYHIKGRSIDCLVTPNHKIYAKDYHHKKFKLHTIKNFKYKTFHKLNQGFWEGKKIQEYKGFEIKNWLKFLGFWLADGYKTIRNNNNRGYVLGFGFKKERKIKFIEKILKNLNIKYHKYKYQKKTTLRIYNKKIYNELKGNTYTKRVPTYIFNLNKKLISIFIESFKFGDGCRNSIYSVNKKLIEDLQRLLLLSGKSGIISSRIRKPSFIGKRLIKSNKLQYELCMHAPLKKLQLKNLNISKENYKGLVYDLTLSKNHILYIRRKGKPCWSGNSSTTGVACLELGRKFICIERDPDYIEMSKLRLKPGLEQRKLR